MNKQDEILISHIKSSTACPFAKTSKGLKPLIAKDLNHNKINGIKKELLAKVVSEEFKTCDFICIDLQDRIKDSEKLTTIVSKILTKINYNYIFMSIEDNSINKESWRYELYGIKFFIIVLSNVYSENHPRFIKGKNLILLQPDHSFHRHLPSKDSEKRIAVIENVRLSFEKKGRGYSKYNPIGLIEALKYICPTNPSKKKIKWW